MPKNAAGNYGDEIFSQMMWLKITSVYIALTSGYNVLFQDTDLVWFRNPIPYLEKMKEDITFMDDGARSPRFTPFFANSGFYYMKYNKRVLYLQELMIRTIYEIGFTHSHQGYYITIVI
jgi:hypothetical protein